MPVGDNLVTPTPVGENAPLPRLWDGTIMDTAASYDEQVRVTLPGADLEQYAHGPCPWMPYGLRKPTAGDPCLVAFDDGNVPRIVWWGPAAPPGITLGSFLFLDGAAYYISLDTEGTQAVRIGAGAGTDLILAVACDNGGPDTVERFTLEASGRMSWGPGDAPLDTFLERYEEGTLTTPGEIQANGDGFYVIGSGRVLRASLTQADDYRFILRADGKHEWGPGGVAGGQDTFLSRSGVDELSTGDLRLQGEGKRLILPNPTGGTVNQWGVDNVDGTFRIYREAYVATGHGSGGVIRLSITDAGVVTVTNTLNVQSGGASFSSGGGGGLLTIDTALGLKEFWQAETQPRWNLTRDALGSGKAGILLGPGGSTAPDVSFGRDATAHLKANVPLEASDAAAVGDLVTRRQVNQAKAGFFTNGGGTLSVSSTGYVGWTLPIYVMGGGYGAHFSTGGYFQLDQPTSGTVTGVGGASNKTATAAGIPLANWETLWYILPIGSGVGSVAANFRVAYNSSALEVPPNWIMVAQRNGDSGVTSFCTGQKLMDGAKVSSGRHFATHACCIKKIGQSLASNSFVVPSFDTTDYDVQGNMADLANDRIVIPRAGIYTVVASLMNTAGTGGAGAWPAVNGNSIKSGGSGFAVHFSGYFGQSVGESHIVQLAAGDLVNSTIYHNSSTNPATVDARLAVAYLGPNP